MILWALLLMLSGAFIAVTFSRWDIADDLGFFAFSIGLLWALALIIIFLVKTVFTFVGIFF